jgi:hypothetical protein
MGMYTCANMHDLLTGESTTDLKSVAPFANVIWDAHFYWPYQGEWALSEYQVHQIQPVNRKMLKQSKKPRRLSPQTLAGLTLATLATLGTLGTQLQGMFLPPKSTGDSTVCRMDLYTHTLIHSYAHTLIRSYAHTLIHSYAPHSCTRHTHTLIPPRTHTHRTHTHRTHAGATEWRSNTGGGEQGACGGAGSTAPYKHGSNVTLQQVRSFFASAKAANFTALSYFNFNYFGQSPQWPLPPSACTNR